jgi:hypothetical protein
MRAQVAAIALTVGLLSCSAAGTGPDPGESGSGPDAGQGGSKANGISDPSGGPMLGGVEPSAGSASRGPGEECAQASAEAELVKEPVDVILVLDNSGSMAAELQAVEDNINLNFAAILAASDVDYRVILLSRHRKGERTASGESSTSICVSSPLSALTTCPAQTPMLSERFYHYNEKIESHDSLEKIISFYRRPDARSSLTVLGYSEWLRVGAKKVFLELTDDDEGGPDDTQVHTVESFFQALVALDPAQFGADPALPNIVWHSIIGLQEKPIATDAYAPDEPLAMAECTGNQNEVSAPGLVYQEMSRRTGGLRFPLCQFQGYDVVFRRIAEDVVTKAQLACDFALPAPPQGETLQLDNIAVSYAAGAGATNQLKQARTPADCQADAFYIENQRVYLCPAACDAVKPRAPTCRCCSPANRRSSSSRLSNPHERGMATGPGPLQRLDERQALRHRGDAERRGAQTRPRGILQVDSRHVQPPAGGR